MVEEEQCRTFEEMQCTSVLVSICFGKFWSVFALESLGQYLLWKVLVSIVFGKSWVILS